MFRPLDVTAALRPALQQDEHLVSVTDKVGLYSGKNKIEGFQDGQLYLTSHRICYISTTDRATSRVAIPLRELDPARTESSAGFLTTSAKVTVYRRPQPVGGLSSTIDSSDKRTVSSSTRRDASWVCPICSFANPVPPSFDPAVANSRTVLPDCAACGIPPPLLTLIKAALAAARPATVEATCPRCTFANHPSVTTCEMCGLALAAPSESGIPAGIPADADCVKFSFRAGGERAFLEGLKHALVQRAWLLGNAPPVAQPVRKGAKQQEHVVGVAHLAHRGKALQNQNAFVISTAFEDLEALMASAKEVLALAESFSGVTKSGEPSVDAVGLSRSLAALAAEPAPGVRRSELARTVADFLTEDSLVGGQAPQHSLFTGNPRSLLAREGGIVTLTDVWAVFNQARARAGAVELVSPEELAEAAKQWEELGLPVRLRRFRKSGVLAVQSRAWSDEKAEQALLSWVRDEAAGLFGKGVTAQETAARFGWSVGVAMEELEMAEERGGLCRDEAPDGVRYWENYFGEAAGAGQVS